MNRAKKYIEVSLATLAAALLIYFTVLALLRGIADQQDADQRHMVEKCQEGWQFYCRKLVKNHVIIGG